MNLFGISFKHLGVALKAAGPSLAVIAWIAGIVALALLGPDNTLTMLALMFLVIYGLPVLLALLIRE